MLDFSAYIQSEWAWVVLAVMAVFVGMSKTGVQGLAILTVPLLAIPFVLTGAFLGIRLVKFLPERGFRIFTTIVTIVSVVVMLIT